MHARTDRDRKEEHVHARMGSIDKIYVRLRTHAHARAH